MQRVLRFGDAFKASQLWQVKWFAAVGSPCCLSDSRPIGEQPCLGHADRDDTNVRHLHFRRTELGHRACDFIIAKLRVLLLGIAMDEKDVGGRQVERSL